MFRKRPGQRAPAATGAHHQAEQCALPLTRATVATAPPHATQPSASGSGATPAIPEAPAHWVAVRAPNLGTFYRAPKPGAAPYVSVGQKVDAETEVCLIEVMKLFTYVLAGVSGHCAAESWSRMRNSSNSTSRLFLIEPA